jgi:putative ABC transport system permease protein
MTRLAIRSLAARRSRTILSALAIVLGVGLVGAAQLLGDSMQRGARELSAAAYGGTDAAVVAHHPVDLTTNDYGTVPAVPASELERVRALPETAGAAGDITDTGTKIIGRGGKPVGTGPYFGIGLDRPARGDRAFRPFRLTSGRFATGPGEVVIDAATAQAQGFHLGDRVRVSGAGAARSYRLTGIASFASLKGIGSGTFALFDLPTAQLALGHRGEVNSILVKARAGVSRAELRDALRRALPAGFDVESAKRADRFDLQTLKAVVHYVGIGLLVFGLIAILIGGFTIFNAMSITVAQRARELALLRSLGAARGQVMRTVLTEALALGAVASVLGLGAGLGLAHAVAGLMSSTGLALPRAATRLGAGTVVTGLAVGLGATLAAALIPARRAIRVAPVAAMRGETEAPGGRRRRRPVRGTMVRLVRALASLLGRPGERFAGTPGRLARRNAMRNPGRTGATAAALTVGLALVVFVSVVGQGIRASTVGSLEDRVAADYVIGASDDFSPISAAAARAAARQPGVESVSALRQDRARAFGAAIGVDGVPAATIGAGYRFDLRPGSAPLAAALAPGGAIVTSKFASAHHLRIGSPLALVTPEAGRMALTVRGIDATPKFNPLELGEVTVGDRAFDAAFAPGRARLAFVSVSGGASAAAKHGLDRALAGFPEVKAQTAAKFADAQVAWVSQVLALLYALLALSIVVSLFGIVNTLAMAVLERTRELGMLRAAGMTRRQVRRMVRHESVVTALIGAAMGTALGLLLARALTAGFASQGLVFSIPVGSLIAFALLAGLAGVVAAALPARRAARLDPLAALAHE